MSSNKRDLAGQRFGAWTVLRDTGRRSPKGAVIWEARCDCGTVACHRTDHFTLGSSHSCGCQKAARIIRDLTGQRFGALVVIEATPLRTGKAGNNVIWRCRCDCGNEHLAPGGELTSKRGYRRSCGCQHLRPSLRHGHKSRKNPSKEYMAWMNAKNRCDGTYRPEFENYGGRGITFYEPWLHRFDLFLEHVGPAPSPEHQIDRIDNNRGYEPGNLRWATRSENNSNRRSNLPLTSPVTGETLLLKEWAVRLGCTHAALQRRIRVLKWPLSEALHRPLKKDRRRKPAADP